MVDHGHGGGGAGQRGLVFSLESVLAFVVGLASLFHLAAALGECVLVFSDGDAPVISG